MREDSTEESSNKLAAMIGECYSTDDVAELLGLTREELEKARNSRAYLAVQTLDGEWFYPTFQFIPGTRTPLTGLNEILLILASGIEDEWTHALWLMSDGVHGLEGKSVRDWLVDGGDIEEPMRLARIDAAAWSR